MSQKTETPQSDSKEEKTEVVAPNSPAAGDEQDSLVLGDPPPEEDKDAEVQEAEGGSEKAEEVPETVEEAEVEYDLKLPDGEPLVREEDLGKIEEFAKEHKLSKEVAQALVDFQNRQFEEDDKASREAAAEMMGKWVDEARNHKDFGREKFDETKADVQRLVNEFADDNLKQALKESGYVNFPPLFYFLARIAGARKEDRIAVASAAAGSEEVPLAHRLYPNHVPGRNRS